ncbi:sporulation protein [Kitasatospora purpeofusca]|uniref:sporulation protein n=1 Tax=Kitasatospora purpeofusca TaxID=67352 RepID=UPI0035D69BD4
MHRRDVLRLPSAAPAVFGSAAMRWMAVPADAPAPRSGERRVGKTDVERVWAAAARAQLTDSRYGGGEWRNSNVLLCLRSAAPLLAGDYSAETGQALHSALAELSRVVGWAAMDAGHHGAADRLLIQALRLARSAGDTELGSYVLATMALKTFLAGWPAEAADMAEAAYERGRGRAAPRVLAFCQLALARALAKGGDGAGAAAALVRCENLLSGIHPGTYDPPWIAYMTPERMATDSAEAHRDLGLTAAARRWAERADTMPLDRYTRAVGIRRAVLGSTHAIDRNLEQAVADGYRALDILSGVRSPRAHSYLHNLLDMLGPWSGDPRVREFAHRVRSDLPPPT